MSSGILSLGINPNNFGLTNAFFMLSISLKWWYLDDLLNYYLSASNSYLVSPANILTWLFNLSINPNFK